MDDKDRDLLTALRESGRASWADLGRRVGLSAPSVQDRVRRLERDGVIRGFEAVTDDAACGLTANALIGLFQRDDAATEQVVAQVRDIDEVTDCWAVAGDEELIVKVTAADIVALESVISRLRAVDGVSRTRTTVIMSKKWERRPPPLP